MDKADSLAKAAKDLMLQEPFYGMFLIMLNKVWTKMVPTAGVSRNGINYQLSINEEFWSNLTPNKHKGLLKHELLHIGFFHLTDYEHLADKRIANIAMDLEINQYIDKDWLPEGGMFLDTFPELNLDTKAGTNYYYEKLQQAAKDGSCPNLDKMLAAMGAGQIIVKLGGGPGGKDQDANVPDHSTWGDFDELDEATKKLIKAQTEHILKEVAEQVRKSRGTIPGEFGEILKKIESPEEAKFDWKGYLRRFAGGAISTYSKKSRRKENIRFEDSAGIKIKPKRRILVGIDTSGSVSSEELKEFLNEIYHIHRSGTEAVIIQCDMAISHIGKFSPKEDYTIHGRGGTSFEPVTNYYNEHQHQFNCLIYFTDGEAPAPDKCRGPVLWVISSKSNDNPQLKGARIKLN